MSRVEILGIYEEPGTIAVEVSGKSATTHAVQLSAGDARIARSVFEVFLIGGV
jgi:hypothetical protein